MDSGTSNDLTMEASDLIVQKIFQGQTFRHFQTHLESKGLVQPAQLLGFLRPGLDEVFKTIQASRPNASSASLWKIIKEALEAHVSDGELWGDIEYLLLNGSPKFSPRKPGSEEDRVLSYIELAANEFRLLILHPDVDPLSEIRCDIRNDNLPPIDKYEALSYVWGDPNIVTPIHVGSRVFQATVNLEQALRALRSEDRPRILWVDAVCINQGDVEEKSIQIQAMGKIYSLAHRVIVWISSATRESELAMSLFEAMIAPLPHEASSSPTQDFGHSANFGVSGPSPDALDTVDGRKDWWSKWETGFRSPKNQMLFSCLQEFLERSWWKRIWVFQELVLADSAVIVCGQTVIAWTHFHRAIGAIHTCCVNSLYMEYRHRMSVENLGVQEKLLVTLADLIVPILVMQLHSSKRRQNRLTGLEELLRATYDYKASDARDKIYGLLSIVSDDAQIHQSIIPNYSVPTEMLYKQVAKYLLEQSGEFPTVAEEADDAGGLWRNGVLCLTSWIPDFGSIKGTPWPIDRDPFSSTLGQATFPYGMMIFSGGAEPISTPRTSDYLPLCNASLYSKPPFPYKFSDDLSCLTVTGFRVDVITLTGSTCQQNGNVERCLEGWQDLLLGFSASNKQQFYIRGGSASEAFWRTVLGNRWHEQPGSSIQQVTDHIPNLGHFPPHTVDQEVKLRNLIKNELHGANSFALCASRKIFQTEQGLFGLGPSSLQTGDIVAVIYGARVPIILHPTEDRSWRVLGDSYVHGIMNGEIVRETDTERTYLMQEFDLY
ncbi:HET-domain-containing protein [Lophiostoma macrostomum CBS 122681]|uniref:HET-domain-containing protein n=1 Tax=Lophiostoma macrostomum CBS 122681 TaxID=1314788 RepID=A0A6A6T3F0_9PLEO|nr:HET-domain-containing protein [Lophiostoma macrostomum CBS 122681]